MMELTYDRAVELLERAVAERGVDYVYPEDEKAQYDPHREQQCSYYVGNNGGFRPSCIIGMVIDYLGLREQFLANRGLYEGNPGTNVLSALGVAFDKTTLSLLGEAQTQQDNGATWGDAVERATAVVEEEW